MPLHPWINYLAGILFMLMGFFYFIADALGWKKFRQSGFVVIFLSEKRWNDPTAKILNVIWGLGFYSFGFWILLKAL
jgi:hypothetical protein